MIVVDPKALEAAYQALDAARTPDDLELAITAYLDVADLVPRTYKRPTAALQDALDERDEARAQLAALREAAQNMTRLLYGTREQLDAVLTDTAQAAARFKRVPEGWGVYPNEPTEEMIDRGSRARVAKRLHMPSALTLKEYSSPIFMKEECSGIREAFQAMLAAAPKPDPGEEG